MSLIKEGINTFLDNIKASIKYLNIINSKLLLGEISHISPKITIGKSVYRVARLGPRKIDIRTKEIIDFKGYLVLDSKGRIINSTDLIRRILPVYEIWYYNYVHAIFPPVFYTFPKSIDIQINIINELNKSVKERKDARYSKEKIEFGEPLCNILKELDNQVLKHNLHSIKKLNYIKKFIFIQKRYFEDLNDYNYKSLFNTINSIRKESIKENAVWLKRKDIWSEFIKTLKSSKKREYRKFDTELIEALVLDLLSLPFSGTGYIILKREYSRIKKRINKWYFNEILEHKLGIDLIEKHIKENYILIKKFKLLDRIVKGIDYSKVRF